LLLLSSTALKYAGSAKKHDDESIIVQKNVASPQKITVSLKPVHITVFLSVFLYRGLTAFSLLSTLFLIFPYTPTAS
jgi:hypothetical protein